MVGSGDLSRKKNDLGWMQKQQRNARATKGAVGSPKDSVSLRSKGDKKQDLVFYGRAGTEPLKRL